MNSITPKDVFRIATDLIYPEALYCICCGKIIDESRPYRLCNDCMKAIKWATGKTCSKCGKPLSELDPSEICYNCKEHAHSFDRGFTCAEYGTHTKAIIFALKYSGRTDIASTIGDIMADCFEAFNMTHRALNPDLVIPVPMFRRKERKRGFNQANLIAKVFAEKTGLTIQNNLVQRCKDTIPMRGLTPDERSQNISGAFSINKYINDDEVSELINGKTILIVDDIYTTGATADEIANILGYYSAREIAFFSFAAGADVVKG